MEMKCININSKVQLVGDLPKITRRCSSHDWQLHSSVELRLWIQGIFQQ